MPVRPFLNREQFDQETVRILGLAFEQACVALHIGDCADDVKQAIADKIIELAKTGERNPDLLCERALKEIRQPEFEAPPLTGADADAHDVPKSKLYSDESKPIGAYTVEQLHMMDAAFRARVVAALRAGEESAAAATATVVTMSRRR
jgi:hypothetical protein